MNPVETDGNLLLQKEISQIQGIDYMCLEFTSLIL